MSTSQQSPSESQLTETEWRVREWLRCREGLKDSSGKVIQSGLEYFALKYVKIQDRVKQATIPLEPWPHILLLLRLLLIERFLIVGKARQIGISWTIAGVYGLWKALFFTNVKGLFLSQGENEAKDLLGKPKFIHDNLPDWMAGGSRNPDSAGQIRFPGTDSELVALPSTEKAGRGTDATFVFSDEDEYHEYAEVNHGAIRPTISAGGQHIIASTANPLVMPDASHFKRLYIAAPENGYCRIFLPYNVRPDRDEGWLVEESKSMPAWQAAGEYPVTEEDMLATLRTMPYFDNDILSSWLPAPKPIPYLPLAQHKTVKVWKPPIVGRKYIVYNDPSDGKTDPHVILCKDAQTGERVANSHGFVPADYCGQIQHDIVMEYNKAFNSYEMNAIAGGIVSQKLIDLETPNQCRRLNTEGKINAGEKRFGQFTGKTAKRSQREKLEEAIRTQATLSYDEVEIKQLLAFYRPEGGDPQAPKGGHDDFISAGGGLEWITPYAVSHKVEVATGQYKG